MKGEYTTRLDLKSSLKLPRVEDELGLKSLPKPLTVELR